MKTHQTYSEPETINLRIAAKKDLVTSSFVNQYHDCDNGTSHSLVVDGQKLLTVNELSTDYDLGVQFVQLSRLSSGEITGYLEVSMVLGNYNTDEIGICMMEAEIISERNLPTTID